MNELDWLDKLEPDEKLLWHGKPVKRYVMSRFNKVYSNFMALGMIFGLGMLVYDVTLGNSFDVPRGAVIALLFFTAGAALNLATWYEHSNAFYALTSKRAFVGMRWFFMWNKIRVFEIKHSMKIHYDQRDPAAIIFAKHSPNGVTLGNINTGVGFRNIAGGDAVYKLMLAAQKNALSERA